MSNYSFDTNHSDENEKSENPYVPDSKETPEFVAQFIEVLDRHLCDTCFKKEDFAAEMGVSISLLNKRIKLLTGLSVADFIRNYKMQLATTLLNDKSISIGEISFKCGYSSIGYFSTVFRKHFGYTPTEYRNRLP